MKAVTFGELVSETLTRMGFAGETGSLKDVVESVVRASHEERVLSRDYTFMRPPAPMTFTTVGGQRTYSLAPYVRSVIWIRDQQSGEPLVESQSAMQMDVGRPLSSATLEKSHRFEFRGHTNVWRQPVEAATINATSNDALDNGNEVTIEGLDADGGYVTETLAVATPGTQEFSQVTNIRKGETAADWEGTLTITAQDSDLTVLATFAPTNFGTYLRQIYLLDSPTVGRVIEYDFWKMPASLEEDNDVPSIPAPFSRILVYDALLSTTGYSRATQNEIRRWEEKQMELQHSLDAAYDEGTTNAAQANYIHYIER